VGIVAKLRLEGNFPEASRVIKSGMSIFFDRLAILSAGIQIPPRLSPKTRRQGVYRCGQCQLLLFTSYTCLARGTDWASFWSPVSNEHLEIVRHEFLGSPRFEIMCARCGLHLGYLFKDSPKRGRRRFSVTLVAVNFCEPRPPRSR
jgi:peptide methionine sulfoxide reductase MsrB